MKAILRHIYLCRTANMSWREGRVSSLNKSNPIQTLHQSGICRQDRSAPHLNSVHGMSQSTRKLFGTKWTKDHYSKHGKFIITLCDKCCNEVLKAVCDGPRLYCTLQYLCLIMSPLANSIFKKTKTETKDKKQKTDSALYILFCDNGFQLNNAKYFPKTKCTGLCLYWTKTLKCSYAYKISIS